MGPTCLFTAVLCLQTVAIVERQVFDFLGHLWTSIVANFLQIIFIMIGFFGACQHRPLILASYLVFSIVWIGWNIFIICFYLEVGILNRDSNVLNMGTGSRSWWYSHGITCRSNETEMDDSAGQSSMVHVGCLLQYYYVEVIHAGVQCLLSTVGLLASSCTLHVFRDDCDSAQPAGDELEYIHMHQSSHEHRLQKHDIAPSLSTVQLSDSSMEQCQSDERLYRQPHRRSARQDAGVRQEHGLTRLSSAQSDRTSAWTSRDSELSESRTPRLASRAPQPEMSDTGPPCYDEYRLGVGNPTATFI